MTQEFPAKPLPTLEESQARRQAPVTTGGQDATVPTLLPGELEEVEQRARRGESIRPRSALGMVGTIYSLTWRVSTRFRQAAEANDRAEHWLERAEKAEDQVKKLEEEVKSRFTAVQVGDFQASEAELIALPLKRQIESLKKGADSDQNALRTIEKLNSQIRDLERSLADERAQGTRDSRTIHHLNREVKGKDDIVKAATGVLSKIFSLINSPASKDCVRRVEVETSDSGHHLTRVIRDIQWLMANYSPVTLGEPPRTAQTRSAGQGVREAATEVMPAVRPDTMQAATEVMPAVKGDSVRGGSTGEQG